MNSVCFHANRSYWFYWPKPGSSFPWPNPSSFDLSSFLQGHPSPKECFPVFFTMSPVWREGKLRREKGLFPFLLTMPPKAAWREAHSQPDHLTILAQRWKKLRVVWCSLLRNRELLRTTMFLTRFGFDASPTTLLVRITLQTSSRWYISRT